MTNDLKYLAFTAMLTAAQMSDSEARAADLFGLLDRFRSGVFDEPSIAVHRVLQSGEPYERELKFADRNKILELRIGLAVERNGNGNGNGTVAMPLCFAIRVRDVTRMKEFEQLTGSAVKKQVRQHTSSAGIARFDSALGVLSVRRSLFLK